MDYCGLPGRLAVCKILAAAEQQRSRQEHSTDAAKALPKAPGIALVIALITSPAITMQRLLNLVLLSAAAAFLHSAPINLDLAALLRGQES